MLILTRSSSVEELITTRTESYNGVFPKCSRTFIEYGDFRESDKPLKYELDLI